MAEKFFQQPQSNQSHFSQVPAAQIERSRFDRSHSHKTTFDAQECVPVFVDEVLPGDTFSLHATAFCRLATPLKPFMDGLTLDLHFFFVPYRLVWDHWENFMGQRDFLEQDPRSFVVPWVEIDFSQMRTFDVAHHFGLPKTESAPEPPLTSVSALPFRAYVKIWNDWFRDENFVEPYPEPRDNGPDTEWDQFAVLPRAKKSDYFTRALPWPQKGSPVYVPLGTTAPISATGDGRPIFSSAISPTFNLKADTVSAANVTGYTGVAQSNQILAWGDPKLEADLTEATALTINDLRTAFQVQRLLERDARGGTRYIEIILSHFGVRSDDGRLQRSEFLGSGTTQVNINPIAQTVPVEDSPQANLAAFGTAIGRGGFTKSFTEHGIVIGIASVRADLTYQNGVERFWFRRTRYDFYWPALSHLGEQRIVYGEIFYTGFLEIDNATWGYQERHAEYRFKPGRVTGEFASNVTASLDVWHLAEDFPSAPFLNQEFLYAKPPIDRVIAVPSEPHFLCDIWFKLVCDRPMPIYSVPGMIDHF